MQKKPEDRRVQRTRMTLSHALLELMVEKGYEAITVQDIIDRANVGRSTFYAHFLDKQDLLQNGLHNLKQMLASELIKGRSEAKEPEARVLGFSLPMLNHAGDHYPLYHAIIGKPSGAFVDQEFKKLLGDLMLQDLTTELRGRPAPEIPIEVVVLSVVSMFMGILAWWMESPQRCLATEVDRMFHRMVEPSLRVLLRKPG